MTVLAIQQDWDAQQVITLAVSLLVLIALITSAGQEQAIGLGSDRQRTLGGAALTAISASEGDQTVTLTSQLQCARGAKRSPIRAAHGWLSP
ncbi:hypothetical protein ACIQWZ_39905 [Streptomyces sp. NPDC098077]|uniref:hypothetical protein n=1 Tax=Streptomyces sp. NPDC098077 TaxID=3366093 RepID=UPI003812390E